MVSNWLLNACSVIQSLYDQREQVILLVFLFIYFYLNILIDQFLAYNNCM